VRRDQVGLDQKALIGGFGQEVDMHLVGPALGAFMAEMGKIEGGRFVLGLTEGQGQAPSVLVTADENVVGPGKGRAADQRIDAVQIAASRGPAPIVERLGEGCLGADQRRLVGRPPLGSLCFHFAHPHGSGSVN
jgi:hypothetical protein